MFIAIEGIDGSGKSTLARRLADDLQSDGVKVHLTREPTEKFRITKEESSRHDVVTGIDLFFRFTTDRFVHQSDIRKHLESGGVVITDRYLYSSLAYQGAVIEPAFETRAAALDWMKAVSGIIHTMPELTLYIDVEPEEAMKRIGHRHAHSGFENTTYLSRVREYYRMVLPENTVILDGRQNADSVLKEAVEAVSKKLS